MLVLISGVGAVVAAIGGGVLLARCFRTPRVDLVGWSVALLALLISLGSQALGYLAGFDSAIFRAMEIGGQAVAPLALAVALSDVAARSAGVRFCTRLYIPALAVVAVVVLALDQLAVTTFTKAWPDPATFYAAPPNYTITFAVAPATALTVLIAVVAVVARSGQPGWNALLPAALLGGAAALALSYPGLAELASHEAGVRLPVRSAFSILCLLAAVLTWLAGVRTARLSLAAVHASGRPERPGWDQGQPVPGMGRGESGSGSGRQRGFEPDGEAGVRIDDGLYRPARPGQDQTRGYRSDLDRRPGDRPGSRAGGGYGGRQRSQPPPSADFATGDIATGDFAALDAGTPAVDATGAFDPVLHDAALADGAYRASAAAARRSREADVGRYDDGYAGRGLANGRSGERHDSGPVADPDSRSQLFGQITIYTLVEDQVEEFDQLTQRIVDLVRGRESDTLVFILHAVPSAPTQRILYEVYRSREAYQRHTAQPYLQQFNLDRRRYVVATNVVELGLQQAKVSPFPSVAELFPEPGYDTSGFERPDYLRDYGRSSERQGSRDRR